MLTTVDNNTSLAPINKAADYWLFNVLLVLLWWMPLPRGSNVVWAWTLMNLTLYLLAGWWIILAIQGKVIISPAFQQAKLALLCFILWLLVIAGQLWPLPPSLLDSLSPIASLLTRVAIGDDQYYHHTHPLSLDPWATQSFLLKSLSYFLLFCLVLLLVTEIKRIKAIVMVIVAGGVIQALYGSFMTLSGIEWLLWEPKITHIGLATGTFANRNHLAGHLNMCLGLGLGWLVAGGQDTGVVMNWQRWARDFMEFLLGPKMRLRIYLMFMTIALVLTRSRMGNTSFFASLLITAGLWLAIRRRRPTGTAILVLTSVLLLDIAILGQWFGLEKVVERIENTSIETETRIDVLQEGIPYITDFYLTGSGAGSFYSTFPSYSGQERHFFSFYDQAHDDYLQFLVEMGILGCLPLAVLVIQSLLLAVAAMSHRNHSYLRALAYGSFMGILAILIHSSTDFNLQIPANAALFVALMALVRVAYGFNKNLA